MQDLIAAHRRSLADALDRLTAEQWRAPSLCAGWTGVHVLAHQTMPFRISEQDFMADLQRCGGDFTRLSDEIADRDSQLSPAELVGVLRGNADTKWSPPGGGLTGALCHDVIHGLDITWPRGLTYDINENAAATVLDSVTGTGSRTLFGFPLDGIKVLATDMDWSAGQGPELTGRARDLIPLLAGRDVPHDLFGGAGAARAWSLTAR